LLVVLLVTLSLSCCCYRWRAPTEDSREWFDSQAWQHLASRAQLHSTHGFVDRSDRVSSVLPASRLASRARHDHDSVRAWPRGRQTSAALHGHSRTQYIIITGQQERAGELRHSWTL